MPLNWSDLYYDNNSKYCCDHAPAHQCFRCCIPGERERDAELKDKEQHFNKGRGMEIVINKPDQPPRPEPNTKSLLVIPKEKPPIVEINLPAIEEEIKRKREAKRRCMVYVLSGSIIIVVIWLFLNYNAIVSYFK